MNKQEITQAVRERYAGVAKQNNSSCGCKPSANTSSTCCGPSKTLSADDISKGVGYSDAEMGSVPEGANLGLGCGNPLALAAVKKGDTVLDLGSGAGFDCFLASPRVGPKGKVIGVDMTPEMLDKARGNALSGNYKNVEFRLGEIENLPVADNTVDLIISNCVINLSQNKPRVFQEAFRVLKPGGKLMVSDIVLLAELPPGIKDSIAAYSGCIAGASQKSEYLDTIKTAGFKDVVVVEETVFPKDSMLNDPVVRAVIKEGDISPAQVKKVAASIVSVKVSASKS